MARIVVSRTRHPRRVRRVVVLAVGPWLAVAGCSSRPESDARADAVLPPATKVEHFYATSPDAERLFYLFRDTLGLPEVWPYQRWGGFASGGVTLGNVVLEFVGASDGDRRSAFAGIALEPAGTTDSLLPALARLGIAHERPDSSVQRNQRGELVGWVNTGLPELAPWGVFFCDYQQRARVAGGRSRASEALAAAGGGALGVRALEEIVLGVTDLPAARRMWRQVGAAPAAGAAQDLLTIGSGPRIRLVPADTAGIHGIVLAVRSLTTARDALAARGALGATSDGRPALAPAAVGGLQISLAAP